MATTPNAAARAPLWAVLSVTFLASLGTGGVTNGVFFLTKEAFGYDKTTNYALALTMGVLYIAAAALAGRAARVVIGRVGWFNERLFAGIALGAVGAVCFLPEGAALASGRAQPWTIWVLILVFAPATGVLWPTVESFLSGGRRGQDLRSAIGRFNITWAVALVAIFWGMGPVLESAPLRVLSGLGVAHLAAGVCLAWVPRTPGRHDPDAFEHEPHPDSYRTQLRVFRVLLPVTYVVLSTLGPYFPPAVERLGVPLGWQTPVVSAWMIARVGCFVVFERWHGWHGRWWVPAGGWALLMAGFGGCVLAPGMASAVGVVVLVASLASLGAGMATIYVGSLYYGMEVGRAEVDAGGAHEAIIGIGYATGPLCGLIAAMTTRGNPSAFDPVLLGVVFGLCLAWSCGGIFGATRRADRAHATPSSPGR